VQDHGKASDWHALNGAFNTEESCPNQERSLPRVRLFFVEKRLDDRLKCGF
jgi:hypothetical protein